MKRVTVANNTQIGTKIKSSPMIALIARAALPRNNSPTIIRANAPIVLSDFLILAKNSSKSSLIFGFLLFGFVEIATNPCNRAFEQFFDFNFSADGGDYAVSRRLTDIDVVLQTLIMRSPRSMTMSIWAPPAFTGARHAYTSARMPAMPSASLICSTCCMHTRSKARPRQAFVLGWFNEWDQKRASFPTRFLRKRKWKSVKLSIS